MSAPHPVRSIVFLMLGALTAFGCVGTTDTGPQGETGSLSLDLVLSNGVEIDEVVWEITGNDMDMSASIDVSAPGSTASFEVFGLPPNDGVGDEEYVVELSAVSVDGKVACRGSAPFDVEVGKSTDVMVMVNCKLPETLGGVRVNGKFNVCAELEKVVVSPLQTSVGNDIDLSALGVDADGDAIKYIWTGDGGSIDDPSAPNTTYTCEEVGKHSVTILVTDTDVYCRMATWTVPVTCVKGDGGNSCDGVVCVGDGNQCTATECNPANGMCETSNVEDGTQCEIVGIGDGVCSSGDCVEVDLCDGVECPDDGNECTTAECNAANGMCETSNVDNGTECEGGEGMCVDGDCVLIIDKCSEVICDDTGNDCTEEKCNSETGMCDTMNVSDGTECNGGAGACSAGDCVDAPQCVLDADCPATGNECIDAVCNAGTCGTSNNTNACDGGAGTCSAGVCEPNAQVFYEQDFESLDQASGTALGTAPGGAGFLVFGNEFLPDGTPIQGYGPFSAPNGTPGFCSIALGQGGGPQGDQVLVIYSDYNNTGNQEAGNLVEANTFQEPFSNPGTLITAADLGTYTFSFDAKRGDINDPTLPRCDPTSAEYTPNPPCDSTARAFIKTLDPSAGFATTNDFEVITTAIPDTWNRYSIDIVIDNALIGQILQFGFAATATNFEPSGVFYDNLLVTVE